MWEGATDRAPTRGDYALLSLGERLWAGGPAGLWLKEGDAWKQRKLPSQLPIPRVHGFASFKKASLVGGLGGLFIGNPGKWRQIDDQTVKQILKVGDAAWVVYGNGAVDKIQPDLDRMASDVLVGAIRRPWTSCVATDGTTLVFGGQGGWTTKTSEKTVETLRPELEGDVVTAAISDRAGKWIATQKNGLFRFDASGKVRVWNPGNGLSDPWVTALVTTKEGILIGTASAGLFLLNTGKIKKVAAPSQRILSLAVRQDSLVVGAAEGAWIRRGSKWHALPTQGEETTSLSTADGSLVITTAHGLAKIP